MTELAIVDSPKTTFMSRNSKRNDERIKEMEDEVKGLEEANAPAPVSEPVVEDTLSKEETSWKKRYSDLRAHQQKTEKTLQDQVNELKQRLDTAASSTLPKTKEEVEKWVAKYPDVARIVKNLARQEAAEETQKFQTQIEEFEKMKQQSNVEKAKNELLKVHPDFDTIAQSDDFLDWLDEQPSWIQNALYEELDVRGASRAMELYKADKNIKPKSNKDAALAIRTTTRSTPSDQDTKGRFSESQVQKMSLKEYEKNEGDIQTSMRNGTFVYDISGGAR